VPAHTVTAWAPRRHRYCVAVFVLNEGHRIVSQLRAMQPLTEIIDILVADGGSTDGAVTTPFLVEVGIRTLLVKTGPGRLGAQMRMAFAYAMTDGYEGVVAIDGNGKDDISAIPRFIEALEGGFDHVQGSRFIHGGAAIHTPLARLLAIRLIHAPLIRRSAGFPYTDTTNGFRGYSRRLLLDERVQPFRDVFNGYELHYYLAIRAAELGFKVMEVPVTRRYPPRGPVPTKISAVRGSVTVLRALAAACRHRFDPAAGATSGRR